MKFWDMISCGDVYSSPQTTQSSAMDAQIVKLTDIVNELKQTVGNGASYENKNTVLNDKEVNQILNRLLELQTKYFSAIPLDENMTKQFVWNIPKDAYKGMRNVLDYPREDIFDPMMVLYLLLSVSPKDAIGQYWMIMNDLIVQNEDEIFADANDYNHSYNYVDTDDDNDNEDNDEDDNNEFNYYEPIEEPIETTIDE